MSATESKITSALEKTLGAVQKLGEADAGKVAEQTGRKYGRESSYLNKLVRMDLLIKRRVGHETLFTIKPSRLVILRLGGSIVSNKSKPFTANNQVIKRLSTEIANALKSEVGPKRLVTILGGGSFGHPIARQYGFSRVARSIGTKEARDGLSLLQHRLTQLVSIMVQELLLNKVPAISVEPQGGLYKLDGDVDASLLTLLLNEGFVPVLHACTIIDRKKNVRIVSADELVYTLAGALEPAGVVVGTDVDGVYPEDPKTSPSAKVIEELHVEDLDLMQFGPTKYADVTSGMLGKIGWMFNVSRLGIDVKLVNGLRPHFIEKALCGERVIGTLIRASDTKKNILKTK
jgi:isopentenyl phosphate kinase